MSVQIFDYSKDYMAAWVTTGDVMDTAAAAKELGITHWVINDAIHKGFLEAFAVRWAGGGGGKKHFVFRDKLEEYRQRREAYRAANPKCRGGRHKKAAVEASPFPPLPVPSRASRLLAKALVKEHMLRREARRRMMQPEARNGEYEQALKRAWALFEDA